MRFKIQDLTPFMAGVFALALALALVAGCGGGPSGQGGSGNGGEAAGRAGEGDAGSSTATADGGRSAFGGGVIHMCGRSVLGGWFEHWGWDYDPENPVPFGGYGLVYHEMDTPPGIVDTAVEAAREIADAGGGVMFFKLCFADFVGGDEESARDNLEANEEMVREVVEAAVGEEGLTLILGNALPMVREYSDEWLAWNHREYNRFLEELAKDSGGRVLVLDLYGTLAAPDGSLRPEYAVDPYDSHLNEAAYDALDGVLRDLLAQLPPPS